MMLYICKKFMKMLFMVLQLQSGQKSTLLKKLCPIVLNNTMGHNFFNNVDLSNNFCPLHIVGYCFIFVPSFVKISFTAFKFRVVMIFIRKLPRGIVCNSHR